MFRTNESDPWWPHLSTCVIYLYFYQNVQLRYSFFLPSSPGVIGPKGAAVKRLQTPQQTFRGLAEPTLHWVKIVFGRWLVQTCALLLRYSIYVTLLIYDFTLLPPHPTPDDQRSASPFWSIPLSPLFSFPHDLCLRLLCRSLQEGSSHPLWPRLPHRWKTSTALMRSVTPPPIQTPSQDQLRMRWRSHTGTFHAMMRSLLRVTVFAAVEILQCDRV